MCVHRYTHMYTSMNSSSLLYSLFFFLCNFKLSITNSAFWYLPAKGEQGLESSLLPFSRTTPSQLSKCLQIFKDAVRYPLGSLETTQCHQNVRKSRLIDFRFFFFFKSHVTYISLTIKTALCTLTHCSQVSSTGYAFCLLPFQYQFEKYNIKTQAVFLLVILRFMRLQFLYSVISKLSVYCNVLTCRLQKDEAYLTLLL